MGEARTVWEGGVGDITPGKYGRGMTAHEFSSHINYS